MLDIKIMTENIDEASIKQVNDIATSEAFKGSKIRIMPDVHAGKGSVVGFTAKNPKHITPNTVGVDIGCGVLTVYLGYGDIDFEKLDNVIREHIPHGFGVHDRDTYSEVFKTQDMLLDLKCYQQLRNLDHIKKSLGTLGGGNHFIEVGQDEERMKYLFIHTGSRNLGAQVAKIYQDKAINYQKNLGNKKDEIIKELKEQGREKEIQETLKRLKETVSFDKDLAYLSPEDEKDYLHDMKVAQTFAKENRRLIAKIIAEYMGWAKLSYFDTMHNYIEIETRTIRKGAIRANLNERVVIPLNMRDGCIIAIGKGNEDWNFSAPHGAGRIMSRAEAKKLINLEDFKETMKDIYTTSVNESTIDEAPFAYKDAKGIVEDVRETVMILDIIEPIYNFKSN